MQEGGQVEDAWTTVIVKSSSSAVLGIWRRGTIDLFPQLGSIPSNMETINRTMFSLTISTTLTMAFLSTGFGNARDLEGARRAIGMPLRARQASTKF